MKTYCYKWEDVLNEQVPRIIIGLDCIEEEAEMQEKAYENNKRKR